MLILMKEKRSCYRKRKIVNPLVRFMKSIYHIVLYVVVLPEEPGWQWGKRGGSVDQLGTTWICIMEKFMLLLPIVKKYLKFSNVGMNNLNIDGNVKTNFGDPITLNRCALSSFVCDAHLPLVCKLIEEVQLMAS